MKLFRKHWRNFTLIELMIVIAIIAIMSMILLPSLNKSRMIAKSINCKSNLKQLGLAYAMYANDYDEWLVACDGDVQEGQVYNGWYRTLSVLGYVPVKVMHCPAEQNVRLSGGFMAYGHNYSTFGVKVSDPSYYPVKRTAVSRMGRDSRLIVFIDTATADYPGMSGSAYKDSLYKAAFSSVLPNDPIYYYSVYMRHSQQANTVMFDGHVDSLKYMEIKDTSTSGTHWLPRQYQGAMKMSFSF